MLKLKDTIYTIHRPKLPKEALLLTLISIMTLLNINIKHIEYETTWIEIKNKKSKNIVCGNVYRHPHHNCDVFFQYLETCLATLAKEK